MARSRFAGASCAILVVALSACGGKKAPGREPRARTPIFANDALTAEERHDFYHLAEGSENVPLSWFLALEVEDGVPFTSRLPAYGFISEPRTDDNPFGLPIGITVDVPRDLSSLGIPVVGINCAACHVSEMTYDGAVLRIDGGPSNVDIERYSEELFAAVKRALDPRHPFRHLAFIRRVWAREEQLAEHYDGSVVARDIDEQRRLLARRIAFFLDFKSFGGTYGGHGRTDAFGIARRFVFGSKAVPDAPVSYPHLWGFQKSKWLHWTANTTSVLERNMGQALGLSALYESEEFASTIVLPNLHRLELIAAKLPPPEWPAQFPAVDIELAKQGATIYQRQGCATCHDSKIDAGHGRYDYEYEKATVVGTDPEAARDFAALEGQIAFHEALGGALTKIRKRAEAELSPDDVRALDYTPTEWQVSMGYASRPLVAIWASPPYLHNGSVPTLDDLLRPVKARPVTFRTGAREYDVDRLGFVDNGDFVFDTRVTGNSNAGHPYGTDLGRADRRALIEYLKVIGTSAEKAVVP